MPTPNEILDGMRLAKEAGDTEAVADLRKMLQEAYAAEVGNPADEMSGTEAVLANLGAGFTNLGLGARQLVGQVDAAEARRKAAIDRRMAEGTTGGSLLQLAGEVAPLALMGPALGALGGAVGGTGAAGGLASYAAGAGLPATAAMEGLIGGALLPTTDDNMTAGRLWNMAAGALGGAAVSKVAPLAGNYAARGVGAARDALARQGLGSASKLAERQFVRGVADPQLAAYRIRQGIADEIPGVPLTTPQALGDRGMLAVERSLMDSKNEAGLALADVRAKANAARLGALEDALDRDPAAIRERAGEWFAAQKDTLEMKPTGFDPNNQFRKLLTYYENRIESPDGKQVFQNLKERLDAIKALPVGQQADQLHQLRMTGINDELDKLYSTSRATAKSKIMREAFGSVKGRFDDYMEKALDKGDWKGLMAGYTSRMRVASQAESGLGVLQDVRLGKPLSDTRPNVMESRQKLRGALAPDNMTDDYGGLTYSPQARREMEDVLGSLDREAASKARDVGGMTGAGREALGIMQTLGVPRPRVSVGDAVQSGVLGAAGLMTGNPLLGVAALAGSAGQRKLAHQAQQRVAEDLLRLYRDPQAALAALDKMNLPPMFRDLVAERLKQATARGLVAGGIAAPAGVLNAQESRQP